MTWYALGAHRSPRGVRAALALDRTAATAYDLEDACAAVGLSTPDSMASQRVFEQWDRVVDRLSEAAGRLDADRSALDALPQVQDQLVAPQRSGRIFAAASNYVDHADEMGTVLAAKAESRPFMFIKPDSSVIGPGAAVELPPASSQVDWEVELAVVIGQTTRHVDAADALSRVAGYTVINDVSARDLNVRDDFPFKFDWFHGKSFDTFAPLGPWIVPAAMIADPQDLRLRLSVNGEIQQDGSTAEMIFTVAEQIAYLSSILTLAPGDVIASGTPDGVGMSRGVYLKPADVMVAEIDRIGVLTNPVVLAG